ncbi:hypothetical protein BDZ88DRAFT_435512 [Geranomyces variabilis]|nr:hypothetical protein BDZ88DRAFT_435512 [Geranomyces variabilis]
MRFRIAALLPALLQCVLGQILRFHTVLPLNGTYSTSKKRKTYLPSIVGRNTSPSQCIRSGFGGRVFEREGRSQRSMAACRRRRYFRNIRNAAQKHSAARDPERKKRWSEQPIRSKRVHNHTNLGHSTSIPQGFNTSFDVGEFAVRDLSSWFAGRWMKYELLLTTTPVARLAMRPLDPANPRKPGVVVNLADVRVSRSKTTKSAFEVTFTGRTLLVLVDRDTEADQSVRRMRSSGTLRGESSGGSRSVGLSSGGGNVPVKSTREDGERGPPAHVPLRSYREEAESDD